MSKKKERMITSKTLAELTKLDITTIRLIAKKIPGSKAPRGWLFPLNSVDWVKARPEKRGRKKKIIEK